MIATFSPLHVGIAHAATNEPRRHTTDWLVCLRRMENRRMATSRWVSSAGKVHLALLWLWTLTCHLENLFFSNGNYGCHAITEIPPPSTEIKYRNTAPCEMGANGPRTDEQRSYWQPDRQPQNMPPATYCLHRRHKNKNIN